MRALEAVLERKKQMPRNGWPMAHMEYCRRFGSVISQKEFISRAKRLLATPGGQAGSVRRFRRAAAERPATTDALFEENTLLEAKLYTETLKTFEEALSACRRLKIECAPRTKKIFSEDADLRLIGVLNRAVEQHIRDNLPKDMSEIAQLIQAVQRAYQKVTEKPRKTSTWRESIVAKITKIEASKALLEKARMHNLAGVAEEKMAMRRMGEMGLVLSKRRDLEEAVHRLSEAAAT